MLREQCLDLGDPCSGPVLEPGIAEVVLDPVQAAVAHAPKYRHASRTAPWAEWLIRRAPGPMRRDGDVSSIVNVPQKGIKTAAQSAP